MAHHNAAQLKRFFTVTAADATTGTVRRLQLSRNHYMPASVDPSSSCLRLADALAAATRNTSHTGMAPAESDHWKPWSAAAQVHKVASEPYRTAGFLSTRQKRPCRPPMFLEQHVGAATGGTTHTWTCNVSCLAVCVLLCCST